MSLSIGNFINISVSTAPRGLPNYSVNVLGYCTKETPVVSPAAGYAVYITPQDVLTDWGSASETYQAALNVFGQSPNILSGGGQFVVYPMQSGQTLSDAITALSNLVFVGGVLWGGYAPIDAEVEAAVTLCQANQTIIFVPSHLTASLAGGGLFSVIQLATQTFGRCLLYTVSAIQARLMAAAYASRAMSVNFSGSQTTLNMHAKDLVNVLPDPGITQTILNTCQTVGADVYAQFGPLPKVFSSGANSFFDQVQNLNWFIKQLQVNGFNAIATTGTKLPQTEPGIAVLVNAYTAAILQGINNGYIAPGAWNSATTFGNPDDLRRNVLANGYFIYSQPVNQQPQADRVARKAPLIQIAIKEAGGVNSSSVLVAVNA